MARNSKSKRNKKGVGVKQQQRTKAPSEKRWRAVKPEWLPSVHGSGKEKPKEDDGKEES